MTLLRLPISVIVLTQNESSNIEACLASVPFASDVVVVDSGSTDDTCQRAAAAGARVITLPWVGFGPQRQAAERYATQPWVIMLDADERFSVELGEEFRRNFPRWSTQFDAISFPRRTWYLGKPMRWYRPFAADRILRCYRLGRATWSDHLVHEVLSCTGISVSANGVVDHFSYTSVTHHLRKAATYIDLWAEQAHGRGTKPRLWLLPGQIPIYLLRDLIWRRGLLDGWAGIVAGLITVVSSLMKRVRLAERYQQQRDVSP